MRKWDRVEPWTCSRPAGSEPGIKCRLLSPTNQEQAATFSPSWRSLISSPASYRAEGTLLSSNAPNKWH